MLAGTNTKKNAPTEQNPKLTGRKTMKEDEAAILREKEKCYLEMLKDSGVGMVNSKEEDQDTVIQGWKKYPKFKFEI